MLFVYILLHPMSYAPNFYQVKVLMKIILVIFISITFVVCQVKNVLIKHPQHPCYPLKMNKIKESKKIQMSNIP